MLSSIIIINFFLFRYRLNGLMFSIENRRLSFSCFVCRTRNHWYFLLACNVDVGCRYAGGSHAYVYTFCAYSILYKSYDLCSIYCFWLFSFTVNMRLCIQCKYFCSSRRPKNDEIEEEGKVEHAV